MPPITPASIEENEKSILTVIGSVSQNSHLCTACSKALIWVGLASVRVYLMFKALAVDDKTSREPKAITIPDNLFISLSFLSVLIPV
ncbi:hypothetical protein LR013_01880 [candidate division NPL-UPA2 bacterium]|nr:hypothetical protein [candidate division NPL-UPA2 bacterium]